MDSTGAQIILDSGIPVFDQFLPQIALFVIIPLLAMLKKWKWLDHNIPTPIIAVIICMAATFGLRALLASTVDAVIAVQTGFAMTGSVLVAHRAMVWAMEKKNGKT